MSAPMPALLAFNYAASIFVGTIGVVLTLLFLKFNYRKGTLSFRDARALIVATAASPPHVGVATPPDSQTVLAASSSSSGPSLPPASAKQPAVKKAEEAMFGSVYTTVTAASSTPTGESCPAASVKPLGAKKAEEFVPEFATSPIPAAPSSSRNPRIVSASASRFDENRAGVALPDSASPGEGFSLSLLMLSGKAIVLDGVLPGDTLESLCQKAASEIASVACDELQLYQDGRLFEKSQMRETMSQLGLSDAMELACIVEIQEQCVDVGAFCTCGLAGNPNPQIADQALNDFVNDYRLRRRTVGFAEEMAQAREARMKAAETSDSSAFLRGVHDEGAHVEELFENQRRTVEFAEKAALGREVYLKQLVGDSSGNSAGDAPLTGSPEPDLCSPLFFCKYQPCPTYFLESEVRALVVDNGSGMCKAGFAGNEEPCVCFPAVVGRQATSPPAEGEDQQSVRVGNEALCDRDVLLFTYPIEHGICTQWVDMEHIWHHMFYSELHIDPAEFPVLLTEPVLNPKRHSERMAEIMFGTFKVPALYIAVASVLALYSSGRTTGIVVDCGDGVTHAVPIYQGWAILNACMRVDLAGRDLTDHLMYLLKQRGHTFTKVEDSAIVRDMKERTCYVALDFDKELREAEGSDRHRVTYELPDRNVITVDSERFCCPEVLFQPKLFGKEALGIQHALFQSLMNMDVDLRSDFYGNVVLSGGTTLLPSMPERLRKELCALMPEALRHRVKVVAHHSVSTWIGGSILASLESFQSSWVRRESYQEPSFCKTRLVQM